MDKRRASLPDPSPSQYGLNLLGRHLLPNLLVSPLQRIGFGDHEPSNRRTETQD
jgi:hypothetical protein